MARINFEKNNKPSVDAQVLIERLLDMEPGDFISYQELSDLIDKDTQQGKGYRALFRARSILEREEQKVIIPIPNEGVRCLTDEEKVESGRGYIGKAGRAGRKGITRVTCVHNFDQLPNDKKIEHNYVLSVAGAIQHFARPKVRRQVEERIAQGNKVLSCDETLNTVLELGIK